MFCILSQSCILDFLEKAKSKNQNVETNQNKTVFHNNECMFQLTDFSKLSMHICKSLVAFFSG